MHEFTVAQDFPAGLDRLWSVFGHPQYARQKYLAPGATAVRVDQFRSTAAFIEVELERTIPVDKSQLPAWMRSLVGGAQTLRHHTQWRRTDRMHVAAELDVSPVGLPVRARGVASIIETTHESTRMELDWRVESVLPVVGAKVERLFAEQLRDALGADHAFTLEYLRQAYLASLPPK